MNILWFKRDLRLYDHEALCAAVDAGELTLLIYIFEPSLQQYPDWDIRHWRFVWQSLQEINQKLANFGTKVHIFHEKAQPIFEKILKKHTIKTVFSYEETGTKVTFDRDKTMKLFFEKEGVTWQEFQTNGIIRGLKNRNNWDKGFMKSVTKPLQNPDLTKLNFCNIAFHNTVNDTFPITLSEINNSPKLMQKGGEYLAWRYLRSFVAERGRNYSRDISKPTNSRKSCARISPYLAWGNLSIRQVYQYVQTALPNSSFKKDLHNFSSRLHWHCHFFYCIFCLLSYYQ